MLPESLVLVGLMVPATALMLLIGGLVGGGVIAAVPVVAGAVVGAILGDIISYVIGRWAGTSIVYRWPLNRYKSGVAKARLFFRRYGFAAVFLGRFFGPLRSTVPLVAGMMSMDQARFQLANIASAIVWAPLMLAPGWAAARGASQFGAMTEAHWLGFAAIVTVLTLVAGAIIGWLMLRNRAARRKPIPGQ